MQLLSLEALVFLLPVLFCQFFTNYFLAPDFLIRTYISLLCIIVCTTIF